jgi:hypothetical protein
MGVYRYHLHWNPKEKEEGRGFHDLFFFLYFFSIDSSTSMTLTPSSLLFVGKQFSSSKGDLSSITF